MLMFLKEKRDSSVKAHMCADGRKQKDGTGSKLLDMFSYLGKTSYLTWE